MVKEDLESRRHTVLGTCLQRLDLTPVLLAVKAEMDRELIEHTMGFYLSISNYHARHGHFF